MGSLPFRCPLHRPATLKVSSDRPSTMTWTVPKASKRTTTHTRRQHEQRAHAQTADAAVAHRVQRQQQHALRDGSCPASTPMRRAARSLIAASANSQQHTRSGCCSLVSEHSSPQQRDAVEASESQLSSCCQRPSTSNADESRKSEHDTRRVLSSAPIVSSAARASDALRERQVFPQNMQSITRPPLRTF